MHLTLNPALYVHPLDVATHQAMVICEVPAQKDASLRYAVPADLLELLRLFDGRRATAEVLAAYAESHGGKYTAEKVEALIESFLLPKCLLIDVDAPAVTPARKAKRPSYIYAKARLIPARAIYPVARALAWSFRRRFVVAWLTTLVAVHLVFYLWVLPGHPLNLAEMSSSRFLLVGLVSLLAAFVHETGHASALASYGCKQAEIGVGLYLYFPVLYTDVTEAWKLGRYQRAAIDIAGAYFQSACLPVLLGLYWLTGSPVVLYAFIVTDLSITRALNPFLRMDGYWLVADLFGIYNLRRHTVKFVRYYAARLFRRGREGEAPPLSLSRKSQVALGVYTVLCVAFLTHLCAIMLRQSVFYLVPDYPRRLLAVWQAAHASPVSLTKLAGAFSEALWRSVVLFGLAMFVYRLGRGALGLLRAAVRFVAGRLTGEPPAREPSAGRV